MTFMTATSSTVAPWYRHRWPWLLMAGPFVVVIASLFTFWLAVSTSDGLVTDEYYKKGLKVNETLAQNNRAKELGIQAGIRLTSEMLTVRVSGLADSGFIPPGKVIFTLSHPTRAGLDQSVLLSGNENGLYIGSLRLPASGHWLILVEDEAKSWRLMASVVLPASGETVIGASRPADIPN